MDSDAHLVPTDGDKNSDDEGKVPVDENSNVMKEKAKPKAEKVPVEPYKPKIPFPQRLKQNLIDPQFSKFLDILKQLKINIPFVEAIAQMPKYARFLKEILSNKKKLAEFETIALSEECSAIVLKKLPPKLKDPGSFTIPCTIGGSYFDKALCDLGASINLMPFSVFKRLGMKEPKPTTISLQLADRSITYPRGIVEDVLVKVGKFIFPTDFVVMDMEEDEDVPIILGRPFLYTGSAIIDMRRGKITFSIDDEEEEFIVFGPSKHFPLSESGKALNSIDSMCSSKCSILQEIPIQDRVKKKNISIGKQAIEAPEGRKNKPFERGREYFNSSNQGVHHCDQRGIQEHYPSPLKNYKFDAHGS